MIRLPRNVRAGAEVAAVATLALVFAAAVAVFAGSSGGREQTTGTSALLTETRALTEDHAAAMLRSSERISASVDVLRGPHGGHWSVYGESMRADADRLEAIALLLRDQGPAIAHAYTGPAGDFRTLQALGLLLAGESRSVAEHGRAMAAHVRLMEELTTNASVAAIEDARVIRSTGAAMVAAAARTRLAGEALAEGSAWSLRALGR